MKTAQLLGGGMLAAFLLSSVGDASGNMPFPRVRPPPQEIAPTTQAHLETAKHELDQVLEGLRQIQKQETKLYGGLLEPVIADVMKAQTNVGQALIYSRDHPEINLLATGPAPQERYARQWEPIGVRKHQNPLWKNLDLGLYQASAAMRNADEDTAQDPILGEIGGFRAKIIEDVARARESLAKCRRFPEDYRRSDRFKRDMILNQRLVLAGVALSVGLALGGLYVVSRRKRRSAPVAGTLAVLLLLSGSEARGNLAPRKVSPPPAIEPTTQAHLEVVKSRLEQALVVLQSGQKGAALYGGFLEHTIADVMKAQADVTQAFIFLKAHPEINPLRAGQAPLETEQPLPDSMRYGVALRVMEAPDPYLFLALDALRNHSVEPPYAPVLGDIGGFRTKIIADIARARASLREGRKYTLGDRPTPPESAATFPLPRNSTPSSVNGGSFSALPPESAAPARGPTKVIKKEVVFELAEVGDTTVVEIPRRLLGSAPGAPVFWLDGGTRVQTVVASVALSIGVALAGLYAVSRRRRVNVPGALAGVGVLALVVVSAVANGPPPNRLPSRDLPLPVVVVPVLRQVAGGPVKVVVVETGDAVRIVLPRSLARQVAALPQP